jgi:hypothetical protein
MILLQNPVLKKAAQTMLAIILLLVIYVLAATLTVFTPPLHAAEKPKRETASAPMPPASFDPEIYRTGCVKRWGEKYRKTCDQRVELLQNLEDAKNVRTRLK